MGKVRLWEADEDAYIRKHYGRLSPAAIADALARPKESVKKRAAKLGVTKKAHIQPCWTCKWAVNPRGNPCPWSENFSPVDGWSATPIIVKGIYKAFPSYRIEKCPLYEAG